MSVKWRTLWRCFLGAWIGGTTILSLGTLGTNNTLSVKLWIGGIAATILLVWSHQDEDRKRIAELERRLRVESEFRDAVAGRLADLMDSARRTDPTYRAAEESRKRIDDIVRNARKTLS